MRQVPRSDVPPFGIAGTGRAASHFIQHFTRLGPRFRRGHVEDVRPIPFGPSKVFTAFETRLANPASAAVHAAFGRAYAERD
jgi:hypothetical protein